MWSYNIFCMFPVILLKYHAAGNNVCESIAEAIAEIISDIKEKYDADSKFRLCNKYDKYRTFDGSCNNLDNPNWGAVDTPYTRYLKNSYCDGVRSFPCSKSKKKLANPREISLKIYKDVEKQDPIWTVLTVGIGQFIAHDLSKAYSGKTATCCEDGKYTCNQNRDPRCAAIPIPSDDPYNGPAGNKCYDYYRTMAINNTKPIQPISGVTHYMDLSQVYGSNEKDAKELRTGYHGKLKSDKRNSAEWLPQAKNPETTCFNVTSNKEPCYRAGDERVNQNVIIALIQNYFLREHNRIADALRGSNPKWNDEKIYQETRRLLIAIYQHIAYYEYLPVLLGRDNMINHKLIRPDAKGYSSCYNSKCNPSMSVECAMGAFRDQHSAISGQFNLYSQSLDVEGFLKLSDYMNKPFIIEEGNNAERLGRCLFVQHQEAVDKYYTSEVTQRLFRFGKTLGRDLRTLDIWHSRDFGIGTYAEALRIFEILPNCTSFEDLKQVMPDKYVELLEKFYDHVENVELVVGAGLEPLEPGALCGRTFQRIMTQQFYNLKCCDRFFYDHGKHFTLDQLNSIRNKSSLAALICNNGDGVDEIQKQPLLAISPSNPRVPCSEIPQVDLSLFNDVF